MHHATHPNIAPHRELGHLEGSGDQSRLCSFMVMENTSHKSLKSPLVPEVDYKQRGGPEMGRVRARSTISGLSRGGTYRLLLFTWSLSDAQSGSPLHKQSCLCQPSGTWGIHLPGLWSVCLDSCHTEFHLGGKAVSDDHE